MFLSVQKMREVSSSVRDLWIGVPSNVLIAALRRLDTIDLVLDHAKCGLNGRIIFKLLANRLILGDGESKDSLGSLLTASRFFLSCLSLKPLNLKLEIILLACF